MNFQPVVWSLRLSSLTLIGLTIRLIIESIRKDGDPDNLIRKRKFYGPFIACVILSGFGIIKPSKYTKAMEKTKQLAQTAQEKASQAARTATAAMKA